MSRQASLEQLCSALIYLLSRQATSPQDHLPALIREHLEWLAGHPDAALLPALANTCERLTRQWPDHDGRRAPALATSHAGPGSLH